MSISPAPNLSEAATPAEGFFGRLSARVADRANPMLVRHTRQKLANRTFLLVYSCLLSFATIASVIAAGSAGYGDGRASAELFGTLATVWTFAVWVYEPIATYRATTAEQEQNTWDLVRLTGMAPKQVLGGMLLASMVQSMLYAAAIAPFFLMTYFLRGIELPTIIFFMVFIPCMGLCASAAAITAGCMGVGRGTRTALGISVAAGSIMIWLASFGAWAGRGYMGGIGDIGSLFIGLGAVVNFTIAWVLLMQVCGAAMMKPPNANRSTGPRVVVFVVVLNLFAWLLAVPDIELESAVGALSVVGIVLANFMGWFSISEDWRLSRRQRQWVDDAPWYTLPWLFGPGAARGRMAWLVLCGLCLIAPLAVGSQSIGSGVGSEVFDVPWTLICYGAIYFALADLLYRGPFKGIMVAPWHRRLLTFIMVAALMVLALLGAMMSFGGDNPLMYLSPVPGFWLILQDGGLTAITTLAAPAIVFLIVQAAVSGATSRREAVTSRESG